jgi:anti-sigma factor RsiW
MAPRFGNGPPECRALHRALDDYYHGRLSDEQRADLEAHAAACADCSSVLRICDELSCRDFVAFLDAYLAGELEPSRREVFDWHVAICPDCRNYLDSYRKTVALGKEALNDPSEAAIPAELIRAILDACQD